MSAPRQMEVFAMNRENLSLTYGTPASLIFTGATPAIAAPWDAFDLNVENDAAELDKFTGDMDRKFIDTTIQNYTGRASTQVWADFNAELGVRNNVWELCGISRNYAPADEVSYASYANLGVDGNVPVASYGVGDDPFAGGDPPDTYAFTVWHWDAAAKQMVRSTGVKCDTFRMNCSGTPGAAAKLIVDMDLRGQGETVLDTGWTGAPNRPTNWTLPTAESYQFSDAGFYVTQSGLVADVELEFNVLDFNIEVRNNLQVGPPGALDADGNATKQIKWLSAGTRDITMNFTVRTQREGLQNENAFNYLNAVRSMQKGMTFYAKFTRGTRVLTINLPDLVIVTAPRQGAMNEVQNLAISCKARSKLSNDAIYVCTYTT